LITKAKSTVSAWCVLLIDKVNVEPREAGKRRNFRFTDLDSFELDFVRAKSVGYLVSRAGAEPGATAPGCISSGLGVVGAPARGVPVPAETDNDQHRYHFY
jgi:hypothetical protein